jgi:hypothetical protein
MLRLQNARALLAVACVALVACSASAASSGTLRVHVSGAGNCKSVGKGTPWSYRGQKGTLYTVVGNRATACAVGIKWLVRLTNIVGFPKTPPGWQCVNAVAFPGQCETRGGAIFEWNAKPK